MPSIIQFVSDRSKIQLWSMVSKPTPYSTSCRRPHRLRTCRDFVSNHQRSQKPTRVRVVLGQLHTVASESKIRARKQNSTKVLSNVPVCCSPGARTVHVWGGMSSRPRELPDSCGSSTEVQEFYLTLIRPLQNRSAIIAKIPEISNGYFNKARDPRSSLL